MFRILRQQNTLRAVGAFAGVSLSLAVTANSAAPPDTDFSDVKYALGLATWVYHFGKNKKSAQNVPFNYGIHSEAINHVIGDDAVSSKGVVDADLSDEDSGLQMAVFLKKEHNRIYVVFRGSEQTELKDWMQDAKIHKDDLGNGVFVHHGFNSVLQGHKDEIYPVLKKLHKQNPTAEIVVTGHSLGGALSTLFGYMAAKELPKSTVRVISFASPRVGNETFRIEHDKIPNLTHVRVVNNRDAITATPSFYYSHVGKTVLHLTDSGLKPYDNYNYPVWTFSIAQCYDVGDHATDSYWARLAKCKW
jgi:hypothetical protein